jgi:cytochrome c-type biogenesis protein CcmH
VRAPAALAPALAACALAFASPLAPAAGAMGAAGGSGAGGAPARASLPAIEREVMCVTCKIPLELAQSPQADRERAFIAALIRRGAGAREIKHELVAQYGSAVLALPSSHGFGLVAYLVPAVALAAVLALLVLLVRRWRRASGIAPSGPGAQQPARAGGETGADTVADGAHPKLSREDAARVAADMSRFE